MSTITSLSISSSGAIRFRWEGTRSAQTLTAVNSGSVTLPGGAKTNLTGWTDPATTTITQLPAGPAVFEVVLGPSAGAAFQPQTGELVKIAFTLEVSGASVGASAAAVVDAPYGPVINAVGAAGQGIATSVGATNQGLGYLTGFPFQVYDGVSAPPGAGGAATGVPRAKGVIDAQMSAVLGRTAGSGGVAGTLAALDRSFTQSDQGPVNTWIWQPRSYAVQSDIGAGVTGRQASLARLAGSIADDIVPLVDGMTPLVPEDSVNPDEIGAAQAIFDESLPAFVTEMGMDGGPRTIRAQGLLTDTATQLQALGMILGALGTQPVGPGVDLSNPTTWGPPPPPVGAAPQTGFPWVALTPTTWWPPSEMFVVTVGDEQNLTNYRIAFDRISILVSQFQNVYMAGGAPGAQPQDRGMLIVLLQRALDASGQAAQAVIDALDSVNLGSDERQVIDVDLTGLTVEDVLSWAVSFPSDEAPSLLQDGGKLGARSIESRTNAILGSVNDIRTPVVGVSPQPAGLQHPRVVYALDLLVDALQDVLNNATPLT
jgi:hypothetical protein